MFTNNFLESITSHPHNPHKTSNKMRGTELCWAVNLATPLPPPTIRSFLYLKKIIIFYTAHFYIFNLYTYHIL